MAEPSQESTEEFAPTREHEFQDSHYHDEEPDIALDEGDGFRASPAPPDKKKLNADRRRSAGMSRNNTFV